MSLAGGAIPDSAQPQGWTRAPRGLPERGEMGYAAQLRVLGDKGHPKDQSGCGNYIPAAEWLANLRKLPKLTIQPITDEIAVRRSISRRKPPCPAGMRVNSPAFAAGPARSVSGARLRRASARLLRIRGCAPF